MKLLTTFLILFIVLVNPAYAKTVRYNFDIDYKIVNYTSKDVKAMTVGGGIPAPNIEATIGDILEVTFNNKMDVETSIHWHGVLLENSQDGVPYLTTMPIKANTSFTYSFPVKHTGTYWYHSHTGLQEQRGVYGALAFYPKKEYRKYNKDYIVVLSDWTNENPKRVFANLKKDGDYYAIKKHSVQSWDQVIKHKVIKKRLRQSLVRMPPMDLSDVGYDAFLSGGKKVNYLGKAKREAKKGDKIRLRIVNASASTYFNLQYSGGDMRVISADGVDVKPVDVSKIKISIAETYDVIITIPENNKSYELRATAADGTGYSSTIIGKGPLVKAPDIPKPILVKLGHSIHNMKGMDHSKMDHSMMINDDKKIISGDYRLLRATKKTTLPPGNPVRTVTLNLTGNMDRYVWSFNNKTLTESDKILIKKGENVKFIFKNTTMMNHPLHLHGHFFRVLNGQGDYAPLKHTVNVPALGEAEIEFYANEEKDWFFHCHNLYHLKSGMARVISYEGSKIDSKLLEARKNNKSSTDNQWFYRSIIGTATNMSDGLLRASNSRNTLEAKYDYNYEKEYEVDAIYERRLNRFLGIFVGGNFERQENEKADNRAIIGIKYVLPLLIETDLRLDSQGNIDLEFESKLQLTERIAFDWVVGTDENYKVGLEYEFNKNISAKINWDYDFDTGVGIVVKF